MVFLATDTLPESYSVVLDCSSDSEIARTVADCEEIRNV